MTREWAAAERTFEHPVIGMSTMAEVFEAAAERHADQPAQMYKGGVHDRSLAGSVLAAAPDGAFATIEYEKMRSIVRRLAAGLREIGIAAGDRIAIFSPTRMEWAQADFATLAAGGVVTTVYSSSSKRQVRYLLDDPDATGVFVADADHLDRVLAVETELNLDFIVSFDALDGHDATDREDIYTLADLHALGAEEFNVDAYERWLDEQSVDNLCSLIYTSGTTGQPKGVKLLHRNFRANINQVYARFGPRPDKPPELPVIDETSRVVSFLPLAHVYERTTGHFVNFAAGATVAYAESPDTLQEDFGLVEPTATTSVPRV
ncbi:MAG: AMP-binding protein, partial [Salinirussus sp.]